MPLHLPILLRRWYERTRYFIAVDCFSVPIRPVSRQPDWRVETRRWVFESNPMIELRRLKHDQDVPQVRAKECDIRDASCVAWTHAMRLTLAGSAVVPVCHGRNHSRYLGSAAIPVGLGSGYPCATFEEKVPVAPRQPSLERPPMAARRSICRHSKMFT